MVNQNLIPPPIFQDPIPIFKIFADPSSPTKLLDLDYAQARRCKDEDKKKDEKLAPHLLA